MPALDDKTFYVEGFAEDDYVVFTVDQNDDDEYVIAEAFAPETASGEVSRVEKDDVAIFAWCASHPFLHGDKNTRAWSSGARLG